MSASLWDDRHAQANTTRTAWWVGVMFHRAAIGPMLVCEDGDVSLTLFVGPFYIGGRFEFNG